MDNKDLINTLIEKSQESFLLAIEIYNKPTIKYRVEGFNYFICNAWELLLKARIIDIQGLSKIYYPVKKGTATRTISLSNCVKKIFTNDKDPLRINLEQIIDLRDTSTHFIIPEYEKIYNSLFQSCLLNYIKKLKQFFGIDVKQKMNTTMLNILTDYDDTTEIELLKKYDEGIVKKLNRKSKKIAKLIDENPNDKLAITIDYNYVIVKNPKDAKASFRITEDADEAVMFVDRPRNANITHPYNGKRFMIAVKDALNEDGIEIKFGYAELKLLCKEKNYYENPNYCYKIDTDATPKYTYSEALLKEVIKLLKKNPQTIENLKEKQKLTSGAKEF